MKYPGYGLELYTTKNNRTPEKSDATRRVMLERAGVESIQQIPQGLVAFLYRFVP